MDVVEKHESNPGQSPMASQRREAKPTPQPARSQLQFPTGSSERNNSAGPQLSSCTLPEESAEPAMEPPPKSNSGTGSPSLMKSTRLSSPQFIVAVKSRFRSSEAIPLITPTQSSQQYCPLEKKTHEEPGKKALKSLPIGHVVVTSAVIANEKTAGFGPTVHSHESPRNETAPQSSSRHPGRTKSKTKRPIAEKTTPIMINTGWKRAIVLLLSLYRGLA